MSKEEMDMNSTYEAISILENWGKVGLPLPKQIKGALSRLKNKDGGL